jgi:hypothetical protein
MASQEFQLIRDNVNPDSRGRLSLGAVVKGKRYRMMVNAAAGELHDMGSFALYAELEVDGE